MSNPIMVFHQFAQADADTGASRSLLDYIRSGREVGLVIILLSLVALGLIITQLLRLRSGSLAPPELVTALDASLKKGDIRASVELCRRPEHASFLARVFDTALVRCARSPFGFLELKGSIEEAGQQEVSRLLRGIDFIGVIAAIAPMLGLLGTVVGMVGAFDTLNITEGAAKPGQLAGSISTALITTVMGLLVAIPATAAHAFLRNRVDRLADAVGATCEQLASHLAHSGAKPAQPGAQRAPQGAGPARTQRSPSP